MIKKLICIVTFCTSMAMPGFLKQNVISQEEVLGGQNFQPLYQLTLSNIAGIVQRFKGIFKFQEDIATIEIENDPQGIIEYMENLNLKQKHTFGDFCEELDDVASFVGAALPEDYKTSLMQKVEHEKNTMKVILGIEE